MQGRRLSQPGWLGTYRDGLLAHSLLPIPVPAQCGATMFTKNNTLLFTTKANYHAILWLVMDSLQQPSFSILRDLHELRVISGEEVDKTAPNTQNGWHSWSIFNSWVVHIFLAIFLHRPAIGQLLAKGLIQVSRIKFQCRSTSSRSRCIVFTIDVWLYKSCLWTEKYL